MGSFQFASPEKDLENCYFIEFLVNKLNFFLSLEHRNTFRIRASNPAA